MSKAILVIEMPTCCKECPFYDTEIIPSCWSAMNFKGRTIVYNETEKQHFCPLKPMPKKIEELLIEETIVSNMYKSTILLEKAIKKAKQRGYNECLDEILGEEE